MIATFISGISFATFMGSGFFFYRFWRGSRDSFFLHFCIACWLLGFERIVLLLVSEAQTPIRTPISEANSWVFLMRLSAFVMILAAIIQRNRSAKQRSK